MLCERCKAEILSPAQVMPAEYFDPGLRTVIAAGQRRKLRPQEWRLLELLWRRRNSMISYEQALAATNSATSAMPEDVLTTVVRGIRQALLDTPWIIHNEAKLGYGLYDAPGQPQITIEEVEDGIPIPPKDWRRVYGYRQYKYPFYDLKPGQSVFIAHANPHTIQSACRAANRRLGTRLVCRRDEKHGRRGMRVWCEPTAGGQNVEER